MKVALITIHNIRHYGSVLQAFATQRLLEDAGAEVEIVDYWRSNFNDSVSTHVARTRWNRNLVTRSAYWLLRHRDIERARRVFQRFLDEHLSVGRTSYHSAAELAARPPEADIYCVGSDQVWNTAYNVDGNGAFYLTWVPAGARKVALASSVGLDALDETDSRELATALGDFEAVSVREDSARAYLAALGVQATQLVDPVLAVDVEHLRDLASSCPVRDDNYLLVYQLNSDARFEQAISEIASARRAKVIRIEHGLHLRSLARKVFKLPPVPEFLALFRDADFVITDSFHGLVLSLVMRRQFAIILPRKFSARLESLLRLVGAEGRVFTKESAAQIVGTEVDYQTVDSVLASERSKFRGFVSGWLERERDDADVRGSR